jgi:hypothetical protein
MASAALSTAVLYTAVGGVFSTIKSGIWGLIQGVLYRYQLSGVVISPFGGKGYCISHLTSTDTLFIDLDPEIFSSLDDDEKELSKIVHTTLNVNRILFQKGKEVVKDLVEMINGITKSFKKIVFLSRDYRLLKYIGIPTIIYTLGSNSYYNSLKLTEENKNDIKNYSDDLKKNKGDKLIIYQNIHELISFFVQTYDAKLKT